MSKIKIPCTTCNGDGYINFPLVQWENFLIWEKDPTEDKANSPYDFPAFLKVPFQKSVSKLNKDTMHATCSVCKGSKFIYIKQ